MKGIQNLFDRFLSILSARILTTIIAIATTPIIARLLGPGGYGNYAVLLSIFSLYMIPFSSAITQGVQKYVAERRADPRWRETVIRFYALVATALGILASLCLVAFTSVGGVERAFGPTFSLYFYLLAALVMLAQLRALTHHVVLGFGLERIAGPLDVLQKLTMVTVGIGLIVAFGLGVDGMLLGHIVANALVALLAAVVICRRISLTDVVRPATTSFPYREVVSFNALNVVLVLAVLSLYHVDVIMLRLFVDDEATGIYKAALSLAEYLWAVPMALQVVLLHSSATLWSDDRREELSALASRVTRYTLLLVLLLAIGLAALADRFVPLYYGDAFAAATTPLLLLIPGVIGFSVARPLLAIGQGSGRIKILVMAAGTVAIANVVLNAALIPRYGLNGAAVATSLSYGSMVLGMVWASRAIGFTPRHDLRLLRIAVTAVIAAVPIVGLSVVIGHDLLALVVVPPVGLVCYVLAAVLTGAIALEEVRWMVQKTPDPIGSAVEARLVKFY